MEQRSMMQALRHAIAALQEGQFAVARDAAAPWTAHPPDALVHAIGRSGAGDVAGGAESMTWVSLQVGQQCPTSVFDPMPGVRDFADTATIIASLDVVVSVDTADAHLAGALGRSVLLLDRYDHCWRWLEGRPDTPWYSGLFHILRQPAPGDWHSVLTRAAALLARPKWPTRFSPADTA